MPEYFFHVGIDLYHPSPTARARLQDHFSSVARLDFRLVATTIAEEQHGPQRSSTNATLNSASGAADKQVHSTNAATQPSGSTDSFVAGNASWPHVQLEDDWRAGEVLLRCVDMTGARVSVKTEQRSTTLSSNLSNGTKQDSVDTLSMPSAEVFSHQHLTSDTVAPIAGDKSTTREDSDASTSQPSSTAPSAARLGKNLSTDPVSIATKAAFEPLDSGEQSLGWGIVRLYREYENTPELEEDAVHSRSASARDAKPSKHEKHGRGSSDIPSLGSGPSTSDCSTVCVLAVPSYMTPADFLGFVGERAREDVSHFRMLRTERTNRYTVLMKFRSGKRARAWRAEWNGKPFNEVESECCHVVFVASIKFRATSPLEDEATSSFPATLNDPFTPPQSNTAQSPLAAQQQQQPLSTRPRAPPTPALKELPTCPVCLERMDESTGLLTILCRHVFHCNCLQKWRGSGCPVCRYTLEGQSVHDPPSATTAGLNECSICHSDANLWVCLICGNVGCGRYDAAHAFLHHKQTSHSFAMDLLTQRVWDYDSDGYVHRIVQSKTDGKLLELPSIPAAGRTTGNGDSGGDVHAAKVDAISLEYSHLLTSQLDSQRVYFEQKLERAADKASRAAEKAVTAAAAAESSVSALVKVNEEVKKLREEQIPRLEREKERAAAKGEKFEGAARRMEKEWREEKAVSASLMERVRHLNERMENLSAEVQDLREQNRDLGFFISGQQKLKELDMGEEVEDATVEVPEEKKGGKKGKGSRKEGR